MIRLGIVGYGNLGKGAVKAIEQNQDMDLVGIFTRRDPNEVVAGDIDVYSVDRVEEFIDKIDVMLLCGGSATDLPEQGPKFARLFNTVDSYDNHEDIPRYHEEMNGVAEKNDNLCAISIGWDPGVFSMNRMFSMSILPEGSHHTFWGPGVSQGHSDAVRRIEGVSDAVQYTIPIEECVEKVRGGEQIDLPSHDRHRRVCYVVTEEDADTDRIEREIKNMPNYFEKYSTDVNFMSEDEMKDDHSGMPHGGFVIRIGNTGTDGDNKHVYELRLALDSNPEFTASVLVAYARAVHRLSCEGNKGAVTVFDVPLSYLSPKSGSELIAEML